MQTQTLFEQLPLIHMFISGGMAYIIGSLSAAIIVCRLMGLPDPRTQGSNNPGATNVMRIGGKKAAAITLFFDALKGFIPVVIARLLNLETPVIAFTAIMAFFGHLYPVFFRFQGGKGVATSLGVLLALNYQLALILLFIWLLINRLTKLSSLAALVAAIAMPLLLFYFQMPAYINASIIIMDIFLVARHRSNIQKLLTGQEAGFGKKP